MTVKNNQGDNPHNLAVLYGHTDLAKFLEESGCDTAPNTSGGRSASRQNSTDEWLQAALKTPTRMEISQVREKVRENFQTMEKKSQKKAKKKKNKSKVRPLDSDDVDTASAAQQGAAGAKRLDADTPIGQVTFPVGQRVVKKAPRSCRLGIGSMGIALFDACSASPLPVWQARGGLRQATVREDTLFSRRLVRT